MKLILQNTDAVADTNVETMGYTWQENSLHCFSSKASLKGDPWTVL
jgi:hypothetical protein